MNSLTWSLKTSAADNSWASVAYGNNIHVAVSSDSSDKYMTSADGVTWVLRDLPVTVRLFSIIYAGGYFVTAGSGGQVLRSVDGITWTLGSYTFVGNLIASVAYGAGMYVMVVSGSSRFYYSTDALTWNTSTLTTNSTNSVTFGNSLFVAVGAVGFVQTSPDGFNWTSHAIPNSRNWTAVTYGNGLFVAVAAAGAGVAGIMVSSDGTTWVEKTVPGDLDWQSVTWGDSLFVSVSNTGTGSRSMISADGSTWVLNATAANNNWNEVIHTGKKFLAVGSSGTGNRVMTAIYPYPTLLLSAQRPTGIKKVYIKTASEKWQTLGGIRNGELKLTPEASNNSMQNNLAVGSYLFESKFELLQTTVAELEKIDSIIDGTNSFLFQMTDAGTIPASSAATEGWVTVSNSQIGVKTKYVSENDPASNQFVEVKVQGSLLSDDIDSVIMAAILDTDFHVSSTANESFSNNNGSAGGTLFGYYKTTTAGDNTGVAANYRPNGISLIELKYSEDTEYFSLPRIDNSKIDIDWLADVDSLSRFIVFITAIDIEYDALATDAETLRVVDILNKNNLDIRLTLFDGKIFTFNSQLGIESHFENAGDFDKFRRLRFKHTGNILTTAFDGVIA